MSQRLTGNANANATTRARASEPQKSGVGEAGVERPGHEQHHGVVDDLHHHDRERVGGQRERDDGREGHAGAQQGDRASGRSRRRRPGRPRARSSARCPGRRPCRSPAPAPRRWRSRSGSARSRSRPARSASARARGRSAPSRLPQRRPTSRLIAVISSSRFSSWLAGAAPRTQWRVWSSTRASATLSSAAWAALICCSTSMQ